jgi:hypothetical protein
MTYNCLPSFARVDPENALIAFPSSMRVPVQFPKLVLKFLSQHKFNVYMSYLITFVKFNGY